MSKIIDNIVSELYTVDYAQGWCGHDVSGTALRAIIQTVIASSFQKFKPYDVAVHCLGSIEKVREAFDRKLIEIDGIEVSREEFSDDREFWILAKCVVPVEAVCEHYFPQHPHFGTMDCEICGQPPTEEDINDNH